MRDIPMFTTHAGVASLVLKEIPYTQTAYVHLRSFIDPNMLLDECKTFCRAVGAEMIYATGEGIPDCYPVHTQILEMQALKSDLPETTAKLFPVQKETLECWRQHYNERMKHVPNAAWMDKYDAQEMLRNGSGYFVHEDGIAIGIGMVRDDVLMALASLKKGRGRDVVLALSDLVVGDTVRLEVASVNQAAISLYEHLGFIVTAKKSAWYKIF